MHAVIIAQREIDISKHSSYYIRGDYATALCGSNWLMASVEALTLILLFNNRITELSLVPRLSLLGMRLH